MLPDAQRLWEIARDTTTSIKGAHLTIQWLTLTVSNQCFVSDCHV